MTTAPTNVAAGHLTANSRPSKELFNAGMLWPSFWRSSVMLNPVRMAGNPVMFIAEVGAALTTLIAASRRRSRRGRDGLLLVLRRCCCG